MITRGYTTTPKPADLGRPFGADCQVFGQSMSNSVLAALTKWSVIDHVRLDITTNQPAVQVYTASPGTPRKGVHGGPSLTYGRLSGVAIEQEGYLDAINTPEWGVDQICWSLILTLPLGMLTYF